jgi:hypothetical protein
MNRRPGARAPGRLLQRSVIAQLRIPDEGCVAFIQQGDGARDDPAPPASYPPGFGAASS